MISKPELARALDQDTYHGSHCQWDGTSAKYTKNGECVSCVKYRDAVKSGRISNGIDMRKEKEKEKNLRFEDI